MFVPSRVRSFRETGKRFQRPPDFDIKEYLDGSFGVVRGSERLRVRLRFTPAGSKYVAEKVWHSSQTTKRTRDGGLVVEFEVSSLVEVKRWVLSWGAACTVEAPRELREQVKAEVDGMARRYRSEA
jgi:predicted DNA-binding transcriptional regulator YafY